MRRQANRFSRTDGESDINLTPMLDVVFIMLIFFIVTATFIKQAGIEILRPEAATGEQKLFWLLLAAAVLHGLAYFLLLPPWMGEDEPWHVEYAHHVATGHTPWGGLPLAAKDREEMPFAHMQVRLRFAGLAPEEIAATEAEILDSMRGHDFWARVDWASWGGGAENFDQVARDHTATTHSPLYYAVSAAGLAIAGKIHASVPAVNMPPMPTTSGNVSVTAITVNGRCSRKRNPNESAISSRRLDPFSRFAFRGTSGTISPLTAL